MRNVGRRRRDRFLHHVAQIAGDGHAPLPGIISASMVSKLAADVGPGQTGDDTDLILVLDFAIAELRHTEIIGDVGVGDFDRLLLLERAAPSPPCGRCWKFRVPDCARRPRACSGG
jgi:hypothetical protein